MISRSVLVPKLRFGTHPRLSPVDRISGGRGSCRASGGVVRCLVRAAQQELRPPDRATLRIPQIDPRETPLPFPRSRASGTRVPRRSLGTRGIVFGSLLLFAASGSVLEASEPDDLLDRWMAVYHDAAKSVEMQFPDKPDTTLQLLETPLLKYANPVRGVQQHGAIYLWTVEDRPAVIASFWSAIERQQPGLRRLNFEWHSLTEESVSAHRQGERLWGATEPGLEWQALDGVRPPADSRPLRLRQMRQIASSFSADIQTKQESELRLMSQPLFRYPEETPGAIDGAIFAFVMGTDPELFLLLEARLDSSGRQAWYAACARFTNYGLVVERNGRQWWSCPMVHAGGRTGRYFLRLAVERLPAGLE